MSQRQRGAVNCPPESSIFFPASSMASGPASASFFLFVSLFLSAAVAAAIHLPVRRVDSCPSRKGLPRPRGLADLAAASLARVNQLKNSKKVAGFEHGRTPPPSPSRSPLLSHSYGGYTISLGFGTPPQMIPLVLDTGSDLVWVPCTRSYVCSNCTFAGGGGGATASLPIFIPRSSSSAKLVGCRNRKCSWIHSPELLSRCPNCTSTACTAVCPPYLVLYGSGTTGGLLLSESLNLSPAPAAVPDFAVGCSVFSAGQPPAGVAGFGRGPASLPSQMGLRRFSYCLISRRFDDDTDDSGSLVLNPPPSSSSDGFSFTPFLKNPTIALPSSVYYYLALRKITVDGLKVNVPRSGSTVIDSGTTFTYMERGIFQALERAMVVAVAGRYNRSIAAERKTGLHPCFVAAPPDKKLLLPQLSFHFKGGAEMRFPQENYFAFAGDSQAACLTIVTDSGGGGGGGGGGSGGPSVILGNFQQQDLNVVYDLERERLGFRRQTCHEHKS